MNTVLTFQDKYEAIIRKDAEYEGIFITAVKTTGIFCRPVCTARKPKPENVEFYDSPEAAILSGYRPCKVCSPRRVRDGRAGAPWRERSCSGASSPRPRSRPACTRSRRGPSPPLGRRGGSSLRPRGASRQRLAPCRRGPCLRDRGAR